MHNRLNGSLKEWLVIALLTCIAATTAQAAEMQCAQVANLDSFYTTGWGNDPSNSRFQTQSQITRSNVPTLSLEWVFALDENQAPHSSPVVTADTIFIGTPDGNLYALDRTTGCTRWSYAAGEAIRSGMSYGEVELDAGQAPVHLLFFGTFDGNVFAVNARTGKQVWKADVKDHPFVMVTGTPSFYAGKLYVPISSGEVALAINPFYGCCTFRGSVRALDAATGTTIWHTHVIDDEPQVTGSHFIFVEEWGPSGAPVWSSPTIDAKRGLLYVGTGENYTQPATERSDAIVAFDMDSGEIVWSQQYTSEDAFNMACTVPFMNANCPDDWGPDLDFGAPPIIAQTKEGRDILLAGQKSGGVYGLDPDTGERIWQTYFGRGGMLGGVHWGMAIHQELGLLYAPISDIDTGPENNREADPGMNAVDISTGEPMWSTPNAGGCEGREGCRPGMSSAITVTDELVFAGSLDGSVQAYDTQSGAVVWAYDTWQTYAAVNNLPVEGGAIDVHGPIVAGEWLYVQSGYGSFGQKGGNALLAFRINPGGKQ